MKHFLKYFLVAYLTLFCTNLLAQDKIVILDLKYVLNESKAGKGAQDFLKKSYNDQLKKFQDIENALKKEEEDLLTKKNSFKQRRVYKENRYLEKKSDRFSIPKKDFH